MAIMQTDQTAPNAPWITRRLVTARHPAASLSVAKRAFTCHRNDDGTYYAAAELGCGKSRATAEEAIHSLLDGEGFDKAGRALSLVGGR